MHTIPHTNVVSYAASGELFSSVSVEGVDVLPAAEAAPPGGMAPGNGMPCRSHSDIGGRLPRLPTLQGSETRAFGRGPWRTTS